MAKKPKQKDIGESVSEGTARITVSKARFFLEQANRFERLVFDYECYIEAAILFGVAALEHLRKEFGRKRGFESWIELREQNQLIKDLIDSRNTLSHQRTMSRVPSQKDVFYLENSIDEASAEIKASHLRLPDQLDEVATIINECEKLYK